MSKWAPYLQSLARIVFGFLILRHGMEQVLGYPEASDSALRSYQGVVELIAVPSALLIMLGLFTRPVSGLLSALYFVAFFVGPAPAGFYTHRNGGDPILLNAFLLSVSGRRGRRRVESGSASQCKRHRRTMGAVRTQHPAHRRRMSVPHARPGEVLQRGRRTDRPRHHDDARPGGVARNHRRSADRALASSRARRRSSCRARWRWPISDRGRPEVSGKASRCRAWKRRFCSASCICSSGRRAQGRGASTASGDVPVINDVEDRP